MSLCRSRLFGDTSSRGRRNDLGVVRTLDCEHDRERFREGKNDVVPMESQPPTFTGIQDNSEVKTPTSSPVKARPMWDSGLGSPSPTSPRFKGKFSPVNEPCSPIPFNVYESSDEKEPVCPPTPFTPPHKKFRSLRLYDTPHTPKSLLQKAQRRVTRGSAKVEQNTKKPASHRSILDPEGPQANVNPFTPESPIVKGKKRPRPMLDGSYNEAMWDDFDDEMPCNKKLALREINTSRFREEFHEVCTLGDGEFGSVFKCVNRLDGCTYAIKRSKVPVAGSALERNALNEVYAHAVLGKHQHVVRYYSAWAENDHMFIQNEFCNGGSLADFIVECKLKKTVLTEEELKQLLLQLAHGLKYVHFLKLVHLDIKPGNIFLHRNPQGADTEGKLEDVEDEDMEEKLTYKIGDLGHVTAVESPSVEEGDCRYLSNEVLQEDLGNLTKADVFSLALTVYETGGGHDLPKNGEEWHEIRKGHLPDLQQCSKEFNDLLKLMISEDPTLRPTAAALIQHPVLCSSATKSKAQLRKELDEEKVKNEMLTKKLLEAEKLHELLRRQQNNNYPRGDNGCKGVGNRIKNSSPLKGGGRMKRLVGGKKGLRSMSTTCF